MQLTELDMLSTLAPALNEQLTTLAQVLLAFNQEELRVTPDLEAFRLDALSGTPRFTIDALRGEATPATVAGIQEFLDPDFTVRLEGDHIHIEYNPD